MTILTFDSTWNGLLSCIFEIYDRRLVQVSIVQEKKFQPDAFSDRLTIVADTIKAKRVWSGLTQYVSAQCLKNIYSCYLSGLPDMENTIYHFIRLTFELKTSPEYAFGHSAVLKISQVAKMVHREKHRMEAFIRFKLTKDGIYYAEIEPDFNVIPLIIRHFKNRYTDQMWLIYDLKRNYGIFYDLKTVDEVILNRKKTTTELDNYYNDREVVYQTLWCDYFAHVNIAERKNKKLHLMHVPKRYWKHLTEKNG